MEKTKFKRSLFIDYETRSFCDLKQAGAHRYAKDPSTEMLLVAYAFDNDPTQVCDYLPDNVAEALCDDSVLKIAHNAEFDMCVTKHVLGLDVNVDTWFDTAFVAAYFSYPRALKEVAKHLRTTQKGAQDTLEIFSLPKKDRKTKEMYFIDRSDQPDNVWSDFCEYARLDVEVMRESYRLLPELPEIEWKAMRLTFEMNFNGVPMDVQLGLKIAERANEYAFEAQKLARDLYGVENLKSVPQVQGALRREGVFLDSLAADKRNGVTHPILDLKDQATGAVFAKIPKAFSRITADLRLRGEFLGHGAHTGRWSSRGVQLQNWKRITSEVSEALGKVESYEHLKQHMRLCLGRQSGTMFTCADLSQIEARIVAWLADCKWRMEAFKNGEDIYARSAEKMFGIAHVSKSDPERQQGKNAELGFGYGGSHVAILKIAPKFYNTIGENKVREIVALWRAANPEVCALWRTLEKAWREAYKSGAAIVRCGGALFQYRFDGKCMRVSLPSGRHLYYRGVHTRPGDRGSELYYISYASNPNGTPTKFWGGTLLENYTQAIARDVLVEIMWNVRKIIRRDGLQAETIGSVHDESWYLHAPHIDMLSLLLDAMAAPTPWAPGLITKGDGFTSDRYRK